MFNFFKKNEPHSYLQNLLPVTTDMHSHILPGIDDGSPDIATSLELIRGLNKLGIKKSITTPHIIGDLYRNTPHTINKALQQTKDACAAEGIDIELSAAAEYMLDDHFMALLKNGEPLLTIHSNIILTEQSYASPNNKLEETVFEIITGGYNPIMAHPERYGYYHKNYDNYHRLKELGFILQVNLLSLTGYYGGAVAKAAKYIMTHELADYVGTDLHHAKHLAALQQKENLQLFIKYTEGKSFNTF